MPLQDMTSLNGKKSSASTILVTISLIATLVFASLSSRDLPQAQAQATALNPATTQLVSQIASQVARVQGVDSTQVSQVLQQMQAPSRKH
jgi:peptidoglycan hydrolase CwlO-like protein